MRLGAIILLSAVTTGCSNAGWGKFWQPESSAVGKGTSAGLGFDPQSISGLRAWFKADSILLPDSSPVTSWVDSSGTGNDLTTGTAPTFYSASNTINGRPVVRFVSASAQYLVKSTMVNAPTSDSASFFVVMKAGGVGGTVLGIGNGCAGDRQYSWVSATNFEINKHCIGQVGQFDPLNWTTGTVRQLTILQQGTTNLTGRANGTAIYSAAPLLTSYPVGGQLTVGASAGALDALSADIAEILFFDTRISDTDAANVECYLGARYGTSTCS